MTRTVGAGTPYACSSTVRYGRLTRLREKDGMTIILSRDATVGLERLSVNAMYVCRSQDRQE